MKKILMVGACLLALSACQTTNPRAGGALIGGVTGGLLGNTVGKGNGRTAATIGGAILGTLVGRELAGPANNNGYQPQQRTVVTVGKCGHISNDGARSSCERGVAERDRASQKQAEQSAYQCGRYGRCN
jgi:predicted lipid-binding transport protein (Tim44 family)